MQRKRTSTSTRFNPTSKADRPTLAHLKKHSGAACTRGDAVDIGQPKANASWNGKVVSGHERLNFTRRRKMRRFYQSPFGDLWLQRAIRGRRFWLKKDWKNVVKSECKKMLEEAGEQTISRRQQFSWKLHCTDDQTSG